MSPAQVVRALLEPLYRAGILQPSGMVDVVLWWGHRPVARRAVLFAAMRQAFRPS